METIHPTSSPGTTGSAAPAAQPPTGEPTLEGHGAPADGHAAGDSVQARRLHYLFRRTTQRPHVLQNALYRYRGVSQP